MILSGVVFLGVLLYLSSSAPGSGVVLTTVEAQTLPTGQDVQLPAASFADGQARFYRYANAAGREVRFFVIKSADGVIRAAFDACDVCYRERRGYHQSGDVMVCNNCGRTFRSVDVNVITGGCNPGPLPRTAAGDQIVITAANIESGASYF